MKKLNTDVFDECIAYDNKGANSFEICFKLFDNDDNKIRLVHLTGLVSETLEKSAFWKLKLNQKEIVLIKIQCINGIIDFHFGVKVLQELKTEKKSLKSKNISNIWRRKLENRKEL